MLLGHPVLINNRNLLVIMYHDYTILYSLYYTILLLIILYYCWLYYIITDYTILLLINNCAIAYTSFPKYGVATISKPPNLEVM